jgi:hypothetical protein
MPLPVPPEVADPIGYAGCQISFEIPAWANSRCRLGEAHKNVLDDILSGVDIIDQNNRQLQQVVSVLFINPSQGILAAALEFPNKQFVFSHLTQPVRKDILLQL